MPRKIPAAKRTHDTSVWLRLGDRWFYLDSEGIMQTGWQEIDGERYYFDEEGVMQTGWQMIDGIWYYFIESGPLWK